MKSIGVEYNYFLCLEIPDDVTPQEIEEIIKKNAPAPDFTAAEYGPVSSFYEEV